MAEINVAIIVGSNRREPIGRKLAHALAKLAEGKLTAGVVQIDDRYHINGENSRRFLQSFIDQFATLAIRHAGARSAQ